LVKLSNGTSTCRPACDDGQFYDEDEKECVDCMEGCNSCVNATSCSECGDGLSILLGSGEGDADQCLGSCPPGYFNNATSDECQECTPGCSSCTNTNRCRACNDFTTLSSGKCLCEFNYDITARPTFNYIRIDFYNLEWTILDDVNITNGERFNCSEIFDFSYASSVDFNLDDIRCVGRDISDDDTIKTRITIRSSDEEQLNLLVNEDVKISLKDDVFEQDCTMPKKGLDLTLDFPGSTQSCHTCGKDGDL
jgi:hypothetical protein